MSLLKTQKHSFFHSTEKMLLAYKKNNTNCDHFTYRHSTFIISQEENNVLITMLMLRKFSHLPSNYSNNRTYSYIGMHVYVYVKETYLISFMSQHHKKRKFQDAIKINLEIR